MDDRQINPGTERRTIEAIEQAIDGEYSAIACYEILFNMAVSDKEKKQIAEIRNDEIHHYQMFSSLYQQLTGRTHAPQITGRCPETYREGLQHAIEDEQKTVDFYMETADRAQNRRVRSLFYRAATDEQQHAVWFLYFYTLNKF
ncbi:ferritin-like domain-containing protein [Sporolactobacillus sp. THM7-4]|nr:ferritin-like domain-containing protein [Sporolactobacillus sp. THM7-4]